MNQPDPSPGETPIEPKTPSTPEVGRRFGVYDSMIAIAWIALLLAYGRLKLLALFDQSRYLCNALAAYYGLIPAGPWGPPSFLMSSMANHWASVIWYVVQVAQLLVLITTPAFLLMRLGRPRPPIRTMLRQPGTVAGLSVGIGVILVAGWLHLLFFGRLRDATVPSVAAGGTVAVAWACSGAAFGWEAEPSWIDRLGRLLGAGAITLALVVIFRWGI